MGVIINFHEVKDQVWLENNLCFLKERYNPVDLPELINSYNGKKELKSICHITVDDGSKSFYDNIYPVLKKHKIPASIYVSPEMLDRIIMLVEIQKYFVPNWLKENQN